MGRSRGEDVDVRSIRSDDAGLQPQAPRRWPRHAGDGHDGGWADTGLQAGRWVDRAVKTSTCDPSDLTMRAFNRKLHEDGRVTLAMATMGDGLTLACKLGDG